MVSFGGYASDEKITANRLKLEKLLAQRNIKTNGGYTFLGYNAPYEIIGRTNEIIIPIEWKE